MLRAAVKGLTRFTVGSTDAAAISLDYNGKLEPV
jgi:hypothetical protein